jgi:hypothetical protein
MYFAVAAKAGRTLKTFVGDAAGSIRRPAKVRFVELSAREIIGFVWCSAVLLGCYGT